TFPPDAVRKSNGVLTCPRCGTVHKFRQPEAAKPKPPAPPKVVPPPLPVAPPVAKPPLPVAPPVAKPVAKAVKPPPLPVTPARARGESEIEPRRGATAVTEDVPVAPPVAE